MLKYIHTKATEDNRRMPSKMPKQTQFTEKRNSLIYSCGCGLQSTATATGFEGASAGDCGSD